VWWFPEGSSADEWSASRPAERWVGGSWEVLSTRKGHVPSCELRTTRDGLVFRRGLKLSPEGEVEVVLLVENPGSEERRGTIGVEWMANLLAGDAHDRWIETADGERHRLGTTGSRPGGARMRDEWLDLSLRLEAGEGSHLRWDPVHTVNQSVGGYERVYQGTSLLQTVEIAIPAGGVAKFRAVVEVGQPVALSPL